MMTIATWTQITGTVSDACWRRIIIYTTDGSINVYTRPQSAPENLQCTCQLLCSKIMQLYEVPLLHSVLRPQHHCIQ